MTSKYIPCLIYLSCCHDIACDFLSSLLKYFNKQCKNSCLPKQMQRVCVLYWDSCFEQQF